MDRLRDPDGCPWDREQTYATLRGYLLEECYEVVDALDRGDRAGLREELGDLLFQIVFLSRLAKEEGAFTAEDVVAGIAAKMIRRHPHVFGEDRADTSEEVVRNWEEIKRKEKGGAGAAPFRPGRDPPRRSPRSSRPSVWGPRPRAWASTGTATPTCWTSSTRRSPSCAGRRRPAVPRRCARSSATCCSRSSMLARRLDVDADEALEGANRKFQARFHGSSGASPSPASPSRRPAWRRSIACGTR